MKRITEMAAGTLLALAMLASGAGCDGDFAGTVEVGDESWEAVFEDSSLGGEEARAIFEDYRSWTKRHGRIWRDPRWAENPGQERRGNDGRLVLAGCLTLPQALCSRFTDGVLGNGGRARELEAESRKLADEFGWLVACDDGHERLVVPKAVSDACRDALELWKEHPGAREKLEELVGVLNRDDPSLWPEAPLDFLFLYDYNESRTAKACRDYERMRNGEIPGENDMVGRYDWSVGPLVATGMFEGHLTACVAMTRRNTQSSRRSDFHLWPFIYDDGHWKMFYCKGMDGC